MISSNKVKTKLSNGAVEYVYNINKIYQGWFNDYVIILHLIDSIANAFFLIDFIPYSYLKSCWIKKEIWKPVRTKAIPFIPVCYLEDEWDFLCKKFNVFLFSIT